MFDHVDFEESQWRVTPVGERAYRDAATDRQAHTFAALALAIDVRARISQHAIDGRSADLQDLVLNGGVQVKMSVRMRSINHVLDLQVLT
jgi:hypothetical protein